MIDRDEKLIEFCTVRQAEYLREYLAGLSMRAVAKKFGVRYSAVQESLKAVESKAVAAGYSPKHDMTHTVPEGFRVKGVSTYYDADGKPRGQWVKSAANIDEQIAMMRAVAESMAEDLPRVDPVDAPCVKSESGLVNCYVITDYHLAMLSHAEETGADWDLNIAEDMLIRWFEKAISLAPDAEVGIFAGLSDLLHSDGLEPLTPASKHVLDVDTRFYKVVRTVIRLLRRVIDMLIAKHKTVHVIMADANHDPVSQIWLREWFSVLYENEPRITVDTNPSPYNCFEWGNTALFFHHGHKRKVANVSQVFAAKFREVFGRTKYAYAHMGHLHSVDVKEDPLMVVEQHRTLAAPDAYAARGGWISGRDAQVITYSKEWGEVSRLKISSAMVTVCNDG